MKLEDTIKGFRQILDGDLDDLAEGDFYMIGPVDEAKKKSKARK